MPIKKYCSYTGCRVLLDEDVKYCDRHQKQTRDHKASRDREYKRNRSDHKEQDFYRGQAWLNARDGSMSYYFGIDIFEYYTKGFELKIDTLDKFIKYVKPADPEPTPAPAAHPKKSGHGYLAVGHGISSDGGWDCGCVDGPYTEAGLMLPIVRVAAAYLRQWGLTITTDADQNNNKNMLDTVAEANAVGADFYVSVHCDYNAAPSGTLPIIYPVSADGARLANAINASVMSRMGMGTRGVMERDDYEVSGTDMKACIFETGSIRQDIGKLLDAEKYGYALAQGIFDGI